MHLTEACFEDIQKIYEFVREVPADENGFLNSASGVSFENFRDEHLPHLIDWSKGKNLPEGFVPETYLFLWHEGEIVGEFRIRHHLTKALAEGAGHIGYCIKKEYRGRGFGAKGLALTLERARKIIPEEEIYLRVNRDNIASFRVIIKNGAYLHHEDSGKYYLRIKK